MTIKIQADSHNTGSYNGGLSDTGWSQNVKVQTPSGTSTLKSISGTWTF